ncbi:probable protein phosphatase 2C 27 [Nymphaea colorata]|nr:probable protein phosphatase 2C 27 [Nymphaea colorata]
MAAGAGLSPPLAVLESGYGKDNGALLENSGAEGRENAKQSKGGRPPRSLSTIQLCGRAVRHANSADLDVDFGSLDFKSPSEEKGGFLPIFRSGSYAEIGPKPYMEDEHICVDNLVEYLGPTVDCQFAGAFYGVFDGHGGRDAAVFTQKNILKFIVEDTEFTNCLDKAIRNAFVKADQALASTCALDTSSGTTALTAFISGRTLVVANAGDCRAVLGKRGRAVEMSRDHKPNCSIEKLRIEKLGGTVYDGYLNGQLSVARALGDWHMKGPKGSFGPLSAEPELKQVILTDEDEFLIMGCDGLWDVMSSQCAVTIARKELMLHNDPERCSRELVREALKRNTCDNLTVIVVCFSPEPPPRIEIPKTRVRRSISAEGLSFLKEVLDSNI